MVIQVKRAILDIETTGLNPFTDEIVAIGLLDIDNNTTVGFVRDSGKNEHVMLSTFAELINRACRDGEKLTFVGYNVRNFDMHFIMVRAMKHGVRIPIENIELLDMMDALFPNGMRYRPLSFVVEKLLGLSKNGHGADVKEWFSNDDVSMIEKYLDNDLKIEKELFLLMEKHGWFEMVDGFGKWRI